MLVFSLFVPFNDACRIKKHIKSVKCSTLYASKNFFDCVNRFMTIYKHIKSQNRVVLYAYGCFLHLNLRRF